MNEEKEVKTKQCIEHSCAFLAVITERFVGQDGRYKECEAAASLMTKPMYAIVQRGTNWDKFKDFPWRRVFFYDWNFEAAVEDIEKDLDFFKTAGGV